MAKLKEAYAEILDNLLLKHEGEKLSWSAREDENSYEVTIGDFAFHVDRKPLSGNPNYRIWIFDKAGEVLDNFDTKSLADLQPADSRYDSYLKVASKIYRDIDESFKLKQIAPALSALKSMG